MKMINGLVIAAGISLMLVSCDVRKKDKIALPLQQIIKDPTSVQVLDSVYDFGKAKEGDIVEHSFGFKNAGKRPLIISEAHASCGCTIPEKPEKPIMPGETGYIKAKFNSENHPGEARKTITVTSNAVPAFPPLIIKGTVEGKQ